MGVCMYIKYLQLINYRNYKELTLELNNSVNLFIGDNAQGKTNILESIYYCSLAKSHRTSKDKELIAWEGQEAYIKLYVVRNRIDKKIEIKIFKEGKKGVNVNSIKINKISELIGNLNAVIFSPEDLKIVKDAPSFRRKFLDMELSQINHKYYYNLVQYNKVLDERNTVMRKWNGKDEGILDVYDEQLSFYGALIIKERSRYLKELEKIGKNIHYDITGGMEDISFEYLTSVKDLDNPREELKKLLEKNRMKDMEKRTTSVGPHRDDLLIEINGIDTRSYGSQGQQRTAVLTLKFASLNILKEETGEYPILLLDDVLSELDASRQKYILSSIQNVQTIITCTGMGDIKSHLGSDAKIFTVKDGSVNEV